MTRYFDVAGPIVERHGGTVEKFIGDAVMAVFGVPVPAETTRFAPYVPPLSCATRRASSR